jgi:acyl dehydratase
VNIEHIKHLRLPSIEQTYEARDTILYALGLGCGADPLEASDLSFVYEEGLKALPSMCCVLNHPRFWLKDPVYEVNWLKLLHAEQAFTIHRPIPATGHVRGEFRILGIEDKGPEKGALLHIEKSLYDVALHGALATVRSTLLLRGDGGDGGFGQAVPAATALRPGAPNRSVEFSTLPSAALIYRLSGDWNPLHADPKVARQAGFDRPILHGLCTLGIACRAILATYCANDPSRLRFMAARFSSPVYPGETIRVEFHEDADEIRFRAIVTERAVVVLDRGSAGIIR